MSSIIRVEKNADNPYAVIDKRFLSRPDLSLKAKGLMALLLSKPNHWTATIGGLGPELQEGRSAVAAAMQELEKAGYMARERARAEGGRFSYETVVRETPEAAKVAILANATMRDYPSADNPASDNRTLVSNERVSNEIKNTPAAKTTALHSEAESIYAAYPRKTGKPSALRAITSAIKRKYDPAFLLERTRAYARAIAGKDVKFIPYPATWFNDDRFNDLTDPSPFATPPKAASCAAKLGVTNTPKEARIFE